MRLIFGRGVGTEVLVAWELMTGRIKVRFLFGDEVPRIC